MDEKNILNKRKVFIWGTGNNAKKFVSEFQIYVNSIIGDWNSKWKENISGFIDSDTSKLETYFYGKKVVSFEKAVDLGMDFCVITPIRFIAIEDYLNSSGFNNDEFIYYKKYLDACRIKAFEIWSNQGKKLYENDRLVKRLYYSGKMGMHMPLDEMPDYVDAMAWDYGDDIDKCYHKMEGYFRNNMKKTDHTVKCIGLYVDRFYGGGIEKVVSLLIPIFLDIGYRVVLITEENNPDIEYGTPESVDRVNLKHKHNGIIADRLYEWDAVIKRYRIDILCLHSGYARLSTFYELLYFKYIGVFSVIEIHSAYKALIGDQPDISKKFHFVYRMADKVVTLSEPDEKYWEKLGCDCATILNPIDSFGMLGNDCKIKKDDKTILWVGRIVQRPKRILDVIPIVFEVKKKISNVRLKIIGAKDDSEIYEELLMEIEKHNLADTIEICDYVPDIHGIYAQASVVLLTSSSESFSNVIAESKLFGVPIVMYELPWLPLVKDGKGIISVGQADTKAAADSLVRLLSDEKLRCKYSDEAKESIRWYMDYDFAERWKSLLEA